MPHHFKGVGLHFKGVGIHFNGIPRHFKGVGLRFKGVAIHFKGHTLRFVLFAAPYYGCQNVAKFDKNYFHLIQIYLHSIKIIFIR